MMSFTFPQGIAGQAASIHQEGMYLWRQGKGQEALPYFRRALALKEQAGDLAAAASSIHMIGIIFAQQKDWENATRYLLRSLEIDAGDRHCQGVATSLNDIAHMCEERGDASAKNALVALGNHILASANRGALDRRICEQCYEGLSGNLKGRVESAVNQLMFRMTE